MRQIEVNGMSSLASLMEWNAAPELYSAVSRLGICVPEVYREAVKRFCISECLPEDVETYWSEVAREGVSSAGWVRDRGRFCKNPGYYRSSYLDSLENDLGLEGTRYPELTALHPCVRNLQAGIEFDGGKYVKDIVQLQIENRKKIECENFLNVETRSLNSIDDLINMVEYVALDQSFSPVAVVSGYKFHRQRIFQRCTNGRIFASLGLIEGRSRKLTKRINIRFFLSDRSDLSGDIFSLGDLRKIVPGTEYYSMYTSERSGQLGVLAQIKIFNQLVLSFP